MRPMVSKFLEENSLQSYFVKGYCGSLLFLGDFCCKSRTVATKTRHPRLDPSQGFSIWYFWIPGKDTKNIKEQLLFNNLKIQFVV